MESLYDKNLMDYYLQRNQPKDEDKIAAYYSEREKLFQTNPEYKKAKVSMDIEFLQLLNKYNKEIIRITGLDKTTNVFTNNSVISHFPNIE
jgi:hypothetical protein